jgi:hypothetical protein
METKLEREVRFLKVYAVIATLVCAVFFLTAFTIQTRNQKFEEIDVERINVVEKDGKLKLVISNGERQHPGTIDGRTLQRKRPPGLLFFNEAGDECGGLSFNGSQRDGKGNAGALLAFDRFRQDQTVGLQYGESNGQYFAGLRVWDRPEASLGPLIDKLAAIEKMPEGPDKTAAMKALREMPGANVADRVMVGRDREQAAVVRLSDVKGRPRIKLSVDAAGVPKLEFLDEAGKVTYTLPKDGTEDKK